MVRHWHMTSWLDGTLGRDPARRTGCGEDDWGIVLVDRYGAVASRSLTAPGERWVCYWACSEDCCTP